MAEKSNKTIINNDKKFNEFEFSDINFFPKLGKLDIILVYISSEVPLPNPYSVINSLNHKTIIAPVVNQRIILHANKKLQLNKARFK